MKTAISIPDEVFERAENFARRAKRSRSQIYSAAIVEYVNRHAPDEVTEAMNRVCAELGDSGKKQAASRFASIAARRTLACSEW